MDFDKFSAELQTALNGQANLDFVMETLTMVCEKEGLGWERGLRAWPGVVYHVNIFRPALSALTLETLFIDDQGKVFIWGKEPDEPEMAERFEALMKARESHIAQKRAELARTEESRLPMT